MKDLGLLLLRISLGWFLLVWGFDKLLNPGHAVNVSDAFYFGLVSSSALVVAGGVVEVALGVVVILGKLRPLAYTGLLLITTVTLLAVWRSILDPLEIVLDGGNPVFFSSAVIWAASFYLWTRRHEPAGAPG